MIQKDFGDESDIVADLCKKRCVYLKTTKSLPFVLRPIEYIKLAQTQRKLASYGMYFPTKYPLGFNYLAEWYILN